MIASKSAKTNGDTLLKLSVLNIALSQRQECGYLWNTEHKFSVKYMGKQEWQNIAFITLCGWNVLIHHVICGLLLIFDIFNSKEEN